MKNFDVNYLMISGIQHFIFCKRQWSLIHIEQLWKDNARTFNGHKFHEKVDNPYIFENRGDIVISRSIPLISHELKLVGISDCIEFHRRKDNLGVKLSGKQGTYDIIPIEYKVGDVQKNQSDISQLCVQAMCLEEMFNTKIEKGYMYYGKSRKRLEVIFNEKLREKVRLTVKEMTYYFDNGITLKASYQEYCKNCSLYDICIPKLNDKYSNVKNYIRLYVKDS